jgi:hypothetical protein
MAKEHNLGFAPEQSLDFDSFELNRIGGSAQNPLSGQ